MQFQIVSITAPLQPLLATEVMENMEKHCGHQGQFLGLLGLFLVHGAAILKCLFSFHLVVYPQQVLIEHLLSDELWVKHWRYGQSA